jgi:choline monooxygenase
LSGNALAFTCPNHAWTYNLDGTLKYAPFMDMKPGFNLDQYQLQNLHTEIWEGFFYITLSKNPKKKDSPIS